MKLITLSDLHVDCRKFFPAFTEEDKEAIAIIPGDICPVNDPEFLLTIKQISYCVKLILFVPGNHEFYMGEISQVKQRLKEFENQVDKFIVLDNKVLVLDGIKFIGSTMWTDMNKSDYFSMHACKNGMNDFWVIKNKNDVLSPQDTVEFFNESVAFIEEELLTSTYDENIKTNIVITHHAPSYGSVVEKYKGNAVNAAFVSELSEMILRNNIKYWIHGHMHSKLDYRIGETRVICNPRGYNNFENTQFNQRLTLPI